MSYQPEPVDTSEIVLPDELCELTEDLAKNSHEIWAAQRLAQGWTYGPQRDDAKKQNPCLVPYAELPDSEKGYDRLTAMETVKTILALGYRVLKS